MTRSNVKGEIEGKERKGSRARGGREVRVRNGKT